MFSEKISKRSISNLLKHFKEEYELKSVFIKSIVDIVKFEPDPFEYMKIFRQKNYVRIRFLIRNKMFYLYHGFYDGKSIGVIISDREFPRRSRRIS